MNITTYKSSDMRRALCLGGLLAMLCVVPLWADPDIANNVTTPYCDDSVLESDTGPVGIEINWAPNHITLNWYEDSSATTPMTVGTSSQSCDYDGTLNVPAAPAARTGYTFRGWRVRQAASCSFASSVCGLTGSQVSSLEASGVGFNPHNGSEPYNANTYGLTSTGTWAVEFTNGSVVRGIASCNTSKPSEWDTIINAINNETMTEAQGYDALWGTCNTNVFKPSNAFTNTSNLNNGDKNCWCKMESYTPLGNSSCSVASSMWVFAGERTDSSDCAQDCAYGCSMMVAGLSAGRVAIFGVSQ